MGVSKEILDELLMWRAPRSREEAFAFFISNGNPDFITALLKDGADVKARDANDATPLMWAAEFNQNAEVIIALLKAGADLEAHDKAGRTALIYAAKPDSSRELPTQRLFECGADPAAEPTCRPLSRCY